MGEANRKGRHRADVRVVLRGRAGEGFTPPAHAMTPQEAAEMLEARGLTAPDKHDIIIVPLGDRIAVAEVGVDEETKRVKAVAGETTMALTRQMLSTLPKNHQLGLVTVSLGRDYDCDEFLAFVREQSLVKNFSFTTMHGPLTCRETFENLFRALGDVTPHGRA